MWDRRFLGIGVSLLVDILALCRGEIAASRMSHDVAVLARLSFFMTMIVIALSAELEQSTRSLSLKDPDTVLSLQIFPNNHDFGLG